MTIEELFNVWAPSERVLIENEDHEELYKGFKSLFPEQYRKSVVKRLDSHLEFFKRNNEGIGAPREIYETDATRMSFRDADYKMFHRVVISKIVLTTADVPQKDPRAYDWGLKLQDTVNRFDKFVPT